MGFEDIVQEVCQVTNLLAMGVQEDRSLKESFFPFLFLSFFLIELTMQVVFLTSMGDS